MINTDEPGTEFVGKQQGGGTRDGLNSTLAHMITYCTIIVFPQETMLVIMGQAKPDKVGIQSVTTGLATWYIHHLRWFPLTVARQTSLHKPNLFSPNPNIAMLGVTTILAVRGPFQ